MRVRLIFLLAALPALCGWGDREAVWPYAGAAPDRSVAVPDSRYLPVGAGTKSFRPVEPMPWGDVNERVAPRHDKALSEAPEKHEDH